MRIAGSLPQSAAARIGGVAVAMVLVAEVAVWVLSPGEEAATPAMVAEGDYFSAGELEAARDYRSDQRWTMLAGLGVQTGVLLLVALGRPPVVRRGLERLGRRPILGAAAAGAGVAVLIELATLPTRLVSHERAVDAGLSSQSLGPWLADVGRSAAIAIVITAAGAALLLALVRRFPRRWWLPGAGRRRRPRRPLRLDRAGRAGADLQQVRAAAGGVARPRRRARARRRRPTSRSARSTASTPAAGSPRSTPTSMASDRPSASFSTTTCSPTPNARELNSVVAHELGHVAHSDLGRGILYIAIVAPLGLLFVRELTGAITERAGIDPLRPAAIPAYLFAIGVASFVLNIPGNQLSRKVEASADRFALDLTGDPQALIDLQLRLARTNLSDPDPPAAFSAVFATHPSTVERIAAALERPTQPSRRNESTVTARARSRSWPALQPSSVPASAGSIEIRCTSPTRAGASSGSNGAPQASPRR